MEQIQGIVTSILSEVNGSKSLSIDRDYTTFKKGIEPENEKQFDRLLKKNNLSHWSGKKHLKYITQFRGGETITFRLIKPKSTNGNSVNGSSQKSKRETEEVIQLVNTEIATNSSQQNPITINVNQLVPPYKLYPHQKKALEKLERVHKAGAKAFRGILKIPTGGGKTHVAVRWAFSHLISQGYKLVWITHRIDLLEQARKEMGKFSGLLQGKKAPQIRMIGGSGYSPGTTLATAKEEILFITFQTLTKNKGKRALKRFVEKNKENKILFVIDEAHHSVASSYKRLIQDYIHPNPNYSLLGLTATPTRTAEREQPILLNLFDNNIIYGVGITELIKQGILAWPRPEHIPTNENFEIEFKKEFNEKASYFEKFHELHPDLLRRIAKSKNRNQVIVNTYIQNKNRYGKTLIFAIDKIHCETLYREFSEKGIRVGYTYSGKNGHQAVVENFKNGNLDVLINIEKLTEGFDEPSIQTVFLARPTQSEILFSQMIGRGLRGLESGGTKEVFLVSFEDHWDRFTGWLDPSIVVPIEAEEEQQEILKRPAQQTVIIPWNVIIQVYDEMRKSNIDMNEFETHKFECYPMGWYTLPLTEPGEGIPVERPVLVFSNQKQSWKELEVWLKKQKKKPSSSEMISFYKEWFDDLPSPGVSIETFSLFVENSFNADSVPLIPDYFLVKDRESSSPDKLAEYIYHESIGGLKKKETITKWYIKHPVLKDIYQSESGFAKEVDASIHNLEYSEEKKEILFSGTPFLEPGKLKLEIKKPDDKKLKELMDSLAKDKERFPQGWDYKPAIAWTYRPMKSYFGKAFNTDEKKLIKMNLLLNSDQIDSSEEVLKYVIYHEMLHFSVSMNHNVEFRLHESKYPNAVEMDGILDTLTDKYEIPRFRQFVKC